MDAIKKVSQDTVKIAFRRCGITAELISRIPNDNEMERVE
jgi:hypothetical protein